MIRRWLAPLCALVGILAFVATCAKGGSFNNGGDDDDPDAAVPPKVDAPMSTTDAPTMPPVDAMTVPDAAVLPPDATTPTPDAPSTQLFCTANSQCTNAGECCLTLGGPQGFCVPGTVVLGVCFPAE